MLKNHRFRINISIVVFSLILYSCTNSNVKKQEEIEAKEIKERTLFIDSISKEIETNLTIVENSGDDSAFQLVKRYLGQLTWNNRKMLTEEDSIASSVQYNRVNELHSSYTNRLEALLKNSPMNLFTKEEMRLNYTIEPFYFSLLRGDTLFLECSFDSKISSVIITSETVKKLIFSKNNIDKLNVKIFIPHTDVYSIVFKSSLDQYGSIRISRIPKSFQTRRFDTKPIFDTVDAIKTEKNSIAYTTIDFINVFNEPHKATLTSKGKKLIGFGESRVVIPIKLPNNTTQWLYRLRISFGEEDKDEDGKFINDCRSSYTTIKAAGKTVYEKEVKYSSLIRELLNNIFSPTKEEAYCNLFVIPDQKNTKGFLNGSNFDYNLNSSQKNIQSMNCEVTEPTKGHIYLGLENTNFSKPVYIWLEVVATIEGIAYYKIIRKVKNVD